MEEEIICYCSNVSKETIVQAILDGATTIDDIRRLTGACTKGNCKEMSPKKRCCSSDILEVLKKYNH